MQEWLSVERKWRVMIGLAVVIAAVLGLAVFLMLQRPAPKTNSLLPAETYKNLSFPVYFPENPPADFKLDSKSIGSTSDVFTYKYDYAGGHIVFVSVQPLDPKLDISTFKPTRQINTPIGKGYLVEFDTRVTVAIVTDKSFILINSPEGVPSFAAEQFAASLRQVK
ncbi:MAG TPA: hypothetical protein VLA88_01760 [Candidatus Saccharimonadales bacterium]|nr:hypothetical protein [Candidatus Saccharimonadales bacterium]